MVSSPCGPVTVLPSSSVYKIINSLALRWCLLLSVAGFTAAGPHILPAFDAPPQRNILILGDSLSAGYGIALDETWVARLAARLDDRGLPFAVANASISGETSGGGLTRLPRLLETFAPALVIIELGANDGLTPNGPKPRGELQCKGLDRFQSAEGGRTDEFSSI